MISDLESSNAEPFPVVVPAGSIVFMSNRLRHKSTGNTSSRFRRVFMPQYSLNPLLSIDNEEKAVGLAIQCKFS